MKQIKEILKQAILLIDANFSEEISITIANKNKFNFHYCSNILFKLKRTYKNFEEKLKEDIAKSEHIKNVEFINGYINLTMQPAFFAQIVEDTMQHSILPNLGDNQSVNVEYCSINPTGFLHIGHARNAILGDAIARILNATNYNVIKEYYINDAGNQIKLLAQSIQARLEDKEIPEGGYVGNEIKEIAKLIPQNANIEEISTIAINYFLNEIKIDLNLMNIHHDSWISEKTITTSGCIQKAIDILKQKGFVYQGVRKDKQAAKGEITNAELMLLKTTQLGDDEDRPLTKSDGSWTYLAPDIGYHLNKIERGAKYLICVLGADHDSYAKRIKIATKLLKDDIKHATPICQLVSFELDGKNVKFSKRKGNAIRVKDFIKEVNPDILRFMILSKTHGTPFVFNYEDAISASMKNPVFYVQYAYARGCSILSSYNKEAKLDKNSKTFEQKDFQDLIITISNFENNILESARNLTPHTMIIYAQKLAESMHKVWQSGKIDSENRVISNDDKATQTRIYIIKAFLKTMKATLDALGINALEKLE